MKILQYHSQFEQIQLDINLKGYRQCRIMINARVQTDSLSQHIFPIPFAYGY